MFLEYAKNTTFANSKKNNKAQTITIKNLIYKLIIHILIARYRAKYLCNIHIKLKNRYKWLKIFSCYSL